MKAKQDNYWIPLADVMSGLMIIFLLIAVSFMWLIQKKMEVKKRVPNSDEIIVKKDDWNKYKRYKVILDSISNHTIITRTEIIRELNSVFENDFKRWNAVLNDDLSIKFKDPSVLFDSGSSTISPYFHGILTEFIPKYLDIVLADKYTGKIAEIRIEGHTDDTRIRVNGNSYIDNMELSQGRARNIAFFIVNREYFHQLPWQKKDRLLYLLTANGLSFGRALDDNYELVYKTKREIDRDKSRRVEFRIIMATDKILEKELKNK